MASELGEQGFRWIIVVNVHGSPLHIGAIDDAGDFFHDTYGGTMVNLWGLVPVLTGSGSALATLPQAQRQEDGVSLHAGLDEHSLMLFLQPALVAPDYRDAPTVTGASYDSSFAVARRDGWPGYIEAPRLANAEFGRRIRTSFSAATVRTAVEVLNGAEPSKYQRYVSFLVRNPLYLDWITSANDRDATLGERERAWLANKKR